MKRLVAALAVVLVLLLLCGCVDGLAELRADRITKIEMVDLFSNLRVEMEPEDIRFDRVATQIVNFQKMFVRGDQCRLEDGHQYQLLIYTDDAASISIKINEDGTFCMGRSHYVAANGAALDINMYASFFENLRAINIDSDIPYDWNEPSSFVAGPVLVQDGIWNYYTQQIVIDGARYLALMREDSNGRHQIVHRFREPYGDLNMHVVEYVKDSMDASGGKMLYFTDLNQETYTTQLLGFSVEQDRMVLSPQDPCSNLLIMGTSGWLMCGNEIFEIDLASGAVKEESIRAINRLGTFSEINGSFFSDPLNVRALRYVELSAGGTTAKPTITITVSQIDEEEFIMLFARESRVLYTYTYDITDFKLI